MIILIFPVPIITSIVFIKKCMESWPAELRDSKSWSEMMLCMGAGLAGWYAAFMLAGVVIHVFTGMSIG
jgi:hypothetical protein